jgi:hypothetical protein
MPFPESSIQHLVPYSLTCLVVHFILWAIFKYLLPAGPWKETPHVTAHQVVALCLMMQWTYVGFFGNVAIDDDDSILDHLPYILHPSSFGMAMARRSVSALWIWDIPVSMFTSDMGHAMDPLMHAHHLGMLLVACVVLGYLTLGEASREFPNPVGSPLAPIFFGQVELSSVPLQVVDLFHPRKSPAWNKYMQSSPPLQTVNETSRQLFALLFLGVRGIYFPCVVATVVVPDFWDALKWTILHQEQATKYIMPIVIVLAFSIFFTLLQMYWALLVVNQIYKALFRSTGKEKKS